MAAKLLQPFLFSNDIDLKTLINIFIFDDDHVLITCKAFIKRFNVSERKQVNSWVTKSWHPFTCGAVKDPKSNHIYTVTNNSSVWVWHKNQGIEHAKKHSFTSTIKEILPCAQTLYVIYSCGFVECMIKALSRHKEEKKQILRIDEKILQAQVFALENQVALLVQTKNKETFLYRQKIGSFSALVRVQLELNNYSLTGASIFSTGNLVTIWSDGNMYTSNVFDSSSSFILGSSKCRVNALKTNRKIKMLELSGNHMVLQGMKCNEEGGIVLLWDTRFGVSVNSKALKMYRDPPLAWSVGSGVVVGDGGHLVYIPVVLAPSTIASLFGARVSEKHSSSDECVSWVTSTQTLDISREIPVSASQTMLSRKSNELVTFISSIDQGSTSEDIIADIVVSEFVRRKDLTMLLECLSAFISIPEKSLVHILRFFIELPEEAFDVSTEREAKKSPRKPPEGKIGSEMKQRPGNEDSDSCTKDTAKEVKAPFSTAKSRAINEALVKCFTPSELSKAMRNLDFNDSLFLLDHLHFLLASGTAKILNDKDTKVPTIEISSVWLSLLLDAHYHQFVMSSEVEIHRKLLTCFGDITSLRDFLEASHSIDILVETILAMKPLPKSQNNRPYSIERLILP